jgi:hypothetical protein
VEEDSVVTAVVVEDLEEDSGDLEDLEAEDSGDLEDLDLEDLEAEDLEAEAEDLEDSLVVVVEVVTTAC